MEINPAFPDQELITNRSRRVTYWEDAISIKGRMETTRYPVLDNVEITGYTGKLRL